MAKEVAVVKTGIANIGSVIAALQRSGYEPKYVYGTNGQSQNSIGIANIESVAALQHSGQHHQIGDWLTVWSP